MRRCQNETDTEPWIEQLVLTRGERPSGQSVRANVVGVSDLTESQRTDVSDACMLFLSDGTVFIPAVLRAAAWEHMQELEERDTFSGLDNTTVSVRKFKLNFHMDPELTSCQFYLTVDQMVTVGQVTLHHRPPSCTMLPSVRQQILMTWRSLMESSVMSTSSQSGLPLSCLMGAWHNDIIMDLLNDAIQKIAAPSAGHLGMATPTHWHRERLRCRGEECFCTPVSHLLIPEEQREMLTADPGVSSSRETPSGLVPQHIAKAMMQPIAAKDRGGDSSAPASDMLEDGHQLTLSNTRAGLSEVWSGGGGGGGGGLESPWDLFHPASDLLAASPSSSASGLERLLQPDGRSRVTEESRIIGPPAQRPHPSQQSPAHQSDSTTSAQEPQKQSPLTSLTHTPPSKKSRVHSDGSSFSYTYETCPNVASALSHYKVPERLVQWAVSYLGTPGHTLPVQRGVEWRKLSGSE